MEKALLIFLCILLLAACGPSPEEIALQTHSAATATAASWTKTPTPTHTPINTPSPTPTDTPTLTPSKTYTPLPTNTITPIPLTSTPTLAAGTIAGNIRLISDKDIPFSTTIELRYAENFKLVKSTKNDSQGNFTFSNLSDDKYKLWVLIGIDSLPTQECNDIYPPDTTWKIGIMFGDKAITSESGSFLTAMILIENLDSPTLVATGIYVVKSIKIEGSTGVYIDAALRCK